MRTNSGQVGKPARNTVSAQVAPRAIKSAHKKDRRKKVGERRRIAIETGGSTNWVRLKLEQLGYDVTVADAKRLKLIWETHSRDGRRDAHFLAEILLRWQRRTPNTRSDKPDHGSPGHIRKQSAPIARPGTARHQCDLALRAEHPFA